MDKNKNNLLYKFQEICYTYKFYLLVCSILFFIVLPFIFSNQYFFSIAIKIGVYILLAMGLNILTGYTGLVSLGHAGFVAIGAYTSSILITRYNFNFFIATFIGMFIAGFIGIILGLPSLRVSGTYLSIITLGFGEIIKMIAMNFSSLTNGTLGIKNIPKPSLFGFSMNITNRGLYYLTLIIVILVSIFCYLLIRSKIGRAFQAIKTNELAATMMGININYYKILAFLISAALCALGGSLYTGLIGYIDPNTFNFDVSTLILSIVILGGMGTIRGMFIGATILIAFPEISRFLMEYRFVLYGLILVIMMRFRPQGILGYKSMLPYSLSKYVNQKIASLGGLSNER